MKIVAWYLSIGVVLELTMLIISIICDWRASNDKLKQSDIELNFNSKSVAEFYIGKDAKEAICGVIERVILWPWALWVPIAIYLKETLSNRLNKGL